MLSRQHDLARRPNPPDSAAKAGTAPRPQRIGRSVIVATFILLASVGAPGVLFVLVVIIVLGSAIPLAHVMFGLPPAMQCEPPAVAAPDRVG
jgi:hypothetical protein